MMRHSTEAMAPAICVFVAWICTVTLLLIAFCCWRMTAILDPQWPRPIPYPDHALLWLNDRYDAAFPSGPDGIKIRGELGRVQLTLWSAVIPPLLVGGLAVGTFLFHARHLMRPGRQREWLMLAMCGGVWIASWTVRAFTLVDLVVQLGMGAFLGIIFWAMALLIRSSFASQ